MKITAFDRATCRVVSEKIEAALQPLAAELGIAISSKGGTYMGGHYTLKVECATKGENGEVNTREADDWKVMAPLYGLKAEDLGRTFKAGGKEYKIAGWRSKARSKPIVATRGDKGFIFAVDDVKMFLDMAAKAKV